MSRSLPIWPGRPTYADAMIAAGFAGRFAALGGSLLDVARQVSAAPGHVSTASDLLLDGLAAHLVRGYSAGFPILRSALSAFCDDMPAGRELRGMPVAVWVAVHRWDDDAYEVLSERWARSCREAGALSDLPIALNIRAPILLFAGDLSAAASLVEEVRAATDATGIESAPYAAMGLAAFRGDVAEAFPLIEANVAEASLRGEGIRLAAAEWASAVLNNSLGRYKDALAVAQQASESALETIYPYWALVELIEAAVRGGTTVAATGAYRRLAGMAVATGSDWALGLQARSRALLTDSREAEEFYEQSIDYLARARMRVELARAHLLYGEWLRRQRRPGDARDDLRTALDMLVAPRG